MATLFIVLAALSILVIMLAAAYPKAIAVVGKFLFVKPVKLVIKAMKRKKAA